MIDNLSVLFRLTYLILTDSPMRIHKNMHFYLICGILSVNNIIESSEYLHQQPASKYASDISELI